MQKLPHPPRVPLFGNTFQVLSMKPIAKFIGLGEKYAPITELNVLGTKLICVYSYDLMKELFDESRFAKFIDIPFEYLREVAGDGLFTAWTHEPNWRKAHNVLLPGFAQRSIRGYYPIMVDVLEKMFARWSLFAPGTYFDITDQMIRFTFETIGLAGFGYQFNNFSTEQMHPFVAHMTEGVQTALLRAKVPRWAYFLMFGRRRRYQQAVEYMNKTVDDIIKERKANPELYRNRIDLLSLMMNAVDKETGTKLDDVNMRYQILTFLVAGHETTATLLSFTFYHLLQNPDILERAYREVDEVLGSNTKEMPTYQQVMNLKYIQQILFECLRLHAPVPMIELYSDKPTTIGGKYPIPANTSILAFIQSLHLDKGIWGENADKFNPDNFTAEAIAQRPADAFKPFGNGVRACIGRQFALLEATLGLGAILQRYKFQGEPNYVLTTDEIPTVKPVGFKLRIEPRQDKDRFATGQQQQHSEQHADVPQGNVVQHHTPMTILYGSNMGTSEEYARRIAQDARRQGFLVQLMTLDAAINKFPDKGILLVISSTYNGYPPDNAAQFKAWLPNANLNAANLSFAVFGCGNTQWVNSFQAFPLWLDENLAAKGISRLMPRGAADASLPEFENEFEVWYGQLWAKLSNQLNLQKNTAKIQNDAIYALQMIDNKTATYKTPYPAYANALELEMVENRELQAQDSPRSTRHIALKLPQGVAYQTGDYLVVYPQNAEELVSRTAAHFQLNTNDLVQLRALSPLAWLPCDSPVLVGDLLRYFVELQDTVTRQQLLDLAALTECPPEKQKLLQWADENQYISEIANKKISLFSIFQQVPACQIPFERFLQMLPALRPRYYSISSSALVSPQVLSITVGILSEPHTSGSGDFTGVCSSFFAQAQSGKTTVRAAIKAPNTDFRLPANHLTPILLIGAGTGIAPLRAFYLERQQLHQQGVAVGKSYLFFGCRRPNEDWLYQQEQQTSDVIEVFTAFSRQPDKQYVQDKLRQQHELVWELLQKDAVVYICGDAAGMAQGVRQAFLDIYQQHTSQSAADAELWLQNLIRNNQYRTDVWSS